MAAIKEMPDQMALVLHSGTVSRWYEFGKATVLLAPEMARSLKSGRVLVLKPTRKKDVVTVIAPIRDSLGTVVGLVEFSALSPASQALVPAWS